jgi:hypothetical protein
VVPGRLLTDNCGRATIELSCDWSVALKTDSESETSRSDETDHQPGGERRLPSRRIVAIAMARARTAPKMKAIARIGLALESDCLATKKVSAPTGPGERKGDQRITHAGDPARAFGRGPDRELHDDVRERNGDLVRSALRAAGCCGLLVVGTGVGNAARRGP